MSQTDVSAVNSTTRGAAHAPTRWDASSRASGVPPISARIAAPCSRDPRYVPGRARRWPLGTRRVHLVHFILATRFLSAGGAQRRRRPMPTRVSSLPTPLRKSRVYIRPILTVTSRPNRTQPRVLGVVPARYSSRRFAGKPLALLRGKPLVMHVYHNACKAKCLDACVVATDDERIAKAVRDHGGEVIMTDGACETSLERCLEVVNRLRRRASKWNARKKGRDSSSVEKQTTLKITGSDKQLVGEVVSKIKTLRKIEPYKGKGVREKGQHILKKEGKKK